MAGKADGRRHWRKDGRSSHRDKQPREKVDSSSPIIQAFQQFQEQLDHKHDKHERLVKLSRDITIESKRTIFLLQRMAPEKRDELIKEAEEKLHNLQETKWREVAKELKGEDPYQYIRAYSPGLQEYIEAVSFWLFLKDHTLVNLTQVEERLSFTGQGQQDVTQESSAEASECQQTEKAEVDCSPMHVHIPPMEFMLGLADLTGELMRITIHSIGSGQLDLPFKYCSIIRTIYDAFVSYGNVSRELSRKVNVLRQSMKKTEAACYALQVRGSEIPKNLLIDGLSDSYGGGFAEDESVNMEDKY